MGRRLSSLFNLSLYSLLWYIWLQYLSLPPHFPLHCVSVSTFYLIQTTTIQIHEPSPVLQDLNKYPWMLCFHSGQHFHPCDYYGQCGLKNEIHFLFLRRFHVPGPNWYIEATIFLKCYTVSPLFMMPLPPYLRLLR